MTGFVGLVQADGVTPVAWSALSVTDSTGTPINPDAMAQVLAYNTDGTLATITATNSAGTWVQTLTYTSGKLTAVSAWVKQ